MRKYLTTQALPYDNTDYLRKYTAQNPMPEQLIWFIFECLALGAHALEYGHEDVTKAKVSHLQDALPLLVQNIPVVNSLSAEQVDFGKI